MIVSLLVNYAFEDDHLVGFAFACALDRKRTCVERFFNVRFACKVRTASLHKAEFDAASLESRFLFDEICKDRCDAAELSVTETVSCRLCAKTFADERAVLVVNTFGHDRYALVAVLCANSLDVFDKFVNVKITFGKINKICAESVYSGKSRRSSEPSCVSAHRFYDAHHRRVVHFCVKVDFHNGGCDVFCRACVSGAMVCAVKVVVDRFGHAHDVALITHRLQIFAYLVAGVHAVVAAVVEEITHVVFLEHFENALIIGVVHVCVFKFVSDRAERGRRRIFEKFEFLGIFLAHIEEFFVEKSDDAVFETVNRRDVALFECFGENTCRTAVDD